MGFEVDVRHTSGSVDGQPPSTPTSTYIQLAGWTKVVLFIRALLSKPASALGLIIFVVFLFLALFGPFLAPYGVNEQIAADAGQPPSAKHWFGTDNLGRDVFSRVVLGAREILSLAGFGTAIAVLFGTTIGLASGYIGGWFDEILMRIFDGLLAMPLLLLALLLLGTLGPSKSSVLLVIIIVYTPIVSRVVRSVVLSVRQRGFIEAARLRGENLPYLLFREILPSVLPALAVEAALRFSYAIFLVASLGFLGVGVQPPSPDWGLMVREARNNVNQMPWAMYYPAAAIAVIVIGVNLLADGIKRVLLESK
ncbi:MAG: ABC transporter permease [Anaerolineae bacterium]|jgi:peptide/nickel transport system permease protein|nr:MAG: ABC transporter permease [Anaerolineae bacterium]